jgi:acetyl-CoA carboxylase biotin carboxyl carrier protein
VDLGKKRTVVESPFVGTFYRSAGPNQDPFVEVGQMIIPGQTLCIVEAMKLMNEIESDAKGRVARILVEDGTPVEFGEALFELEA